MSTSLAAPSALPILTPKEAAVGIEMQVLGNIISALAYSAVVILFCSCCWALHNPPRMLSRWMRPLLYIYLVFMFAMSTTTFIQETIYTTKVIKNDIFPTGPALVDYLTSLGEPLPLPFTIWGADGFMLWRCLVLYRGIGPVRHFILVVFLALLSLTSLGSGIAFFAVAGIWRSQFGEAGSLPFIPDSLALPVQNTKQSAVSSVIMFCTTFVNLVLALLVFLRLLYYQKYISQTLGTAHASPYMKVISPMLIVYRVAIGRSASANRPSGLTNHGAGGHIDHTTIRFDHPISTAGNVDDFLEDSTESNPVIPFDNIELKEGPKDRFTSSASEGREVGHWCHYKEKLAKPVTGIGVEEYLQEALGGTDRMQAQRKKQFWTNLSTFISCASTYQSTQMHERFPPSWKFHCLER
ncbi:hypothetical protein GALMADRAFT_280844, partial [Galerina marginata CBS 339.88]